jgi:hypothetical protein
MMRSVRERKERECCVQVRSAAATLKDIKKRKKNDAIYTCLDRYTCAQQQQQHQHDDLLDKLEKF